MDEAPIEQLLQLAHAAQSHAAIEHGWMLDAEGVETADRVLDAQRRRGCNEQLEALAACYGAWFGRWACDRLGAQWIGLHEPSAPRLNVHGVICSPIDATGRRLQDASAPGLVDLVQRMRRWTRDAQQRSAEYLSTNEAAWDHMAADHAFAGPIALPPDRIAAQAAIDPWLRAYGVEGRRLLCLAAGGGRHGPLHALAGADVTVVDISSEQLRHDQRAARDHGLQLQTVRASIDNLSALPSGGFDIILQPVSACYLPDLAPMHADVARVLRSGGMYVVQHKQPGSLQASAEPIAGHYAVQHPQVEGARLSAVDGVGYRERGTVEFLHTLDTLLGGLCRAGLVIEDVIEPPRADAFAHAPSEGHRSCYLPPYLKIKARRV